MANPPAVRGPTFGEGDGPLEDGNALQVKHKTQNQTFSSTSFIDDDQIQFPLTGNAEYVFRFVVFYSTTVSGEAYDMSLNGPAGPGTLRFSISMNSSATVRQLVVRTAYDSGLGLTTGFGTTVLMGEIFGYVAVPPSGGTLALRHKIETGAPEVGTVYAGSWGELRRVA